MVRYLEAIFEAGVLRPLQPLLLPEHHHVMVTIDDRLIVAAAEFNHDVPIAEYMLMTEPVHARIDPSMRDRSANHPLELDDLGRTQTYYVDLERYVGEVPAPVRLSMGARLARHFKLSMRSLPMFIKIGNACAGFRNVPDAPPLPAR